MKKITRLLISFLLILSVTACAPSISELPTYPVNPSEPTAPSTPHVELSDSKDNSAPQAEPSHPEGNSAPQVESSGGTVERELPEDGSYTTKEDVALYIHLYGCLPSNFITKKEAEALGWKGGSLEPFAPGMCIGGNHFGNYEGLLPEKKGRNYTECDIDTLGADKRGAKRIVFSNDGLIYYTEDHYESFELLYGED